MRKPRRDRNFSGVYYQNVRLLLAAAEKTGRIDLLINYAGGNEARCCSSYKPIYEQPQEVIDWGLDTNLKGAVYFSRACMPYMVKAKAGVIVTLGSVTGFECDGNSTYGITKAGLDRLKSYFPMLERLGREYADKNLTLGSARSASRPAPF